jgi:glutamate racemase
MKIGVFDSGVGGKAVANALELSFPSCDIVYENDAENIPYGTKTEEELYNLSLPHILSLQTAGCDAIVVACNTISTTILSKLQESVKVPLIGVEPMIEQATALSKSGVIAVCATPRTLASIRYKELCARYATNAAIIEPNCSDWALMIEQDSIDRQRIKATIDDCLEQKADVIVLGCTHYHWIEQIIDTYAADKAIVLQPEQATISKLRKVLSQLT